MEFQTLKRSHLKRNIIIGVLVVGIISAVVLNFTRAKYRTTQSIPLVNGTINYELSDLNLIGVYIEEGDDYTKVDQIPNSGYTLNEEKSYCKIGDELQDMTITYDMNTKNLTIAPMTSKGTKCYLYFDEQKILLADAIKRDNTINTTTPNFNKTAQADCSGASMCEETNGLYKTEDDWGESYYFRGAVENNWVKFAGYYWRIIRINGDESIRVIYSGNEESGPVATGESTMISSSQVFNEKYNRSEYAGYMYTSGQQHGNTTNSDIKTVVDNWYAANIANKEYLKYVSTEAGFCGDRNLKSGSWSSTGSTLYYAAYGRLIDNKTPTLKCSNSADLYTISSSSKGNKELSNSVGLITVDEVSMAGGVNGSNNTSYYLYTGQAYWTMSPYLFDGIYAHVFFILSNGQLYSNNLGSTRGVRPVINLAHDVVIKSGNGTSSTPYEI